MKYIDIVVGNCAVQNITARRENGDLYRINTSLQGIKKLRK